MFDLTPDPIAFTLGPITVHWYGVMYAIGLAAVYILLVRLAARRGRDPEIVANGMLVVAVAALIGGRLYHVIDQWQLYKDNLPAIILPPYSGLGVYGGIITGTIAAWAYTRWRHEPFLVWADIIAPGLFLMQAIGRWGNFFNQELYGPPTSLPWGIPIECANRIAAYPCETYPEATTRFHPLFLYESIAGLLGMLFLLWLGNRFRDRLRPGDLLLVFFVWYGVVRFSLEALRSGNWTFFGIPTAQIVSLAFIVIGIVGLAWRHRPNRPPDVEPEPLVTTTAATDNEAATAEPDATAPDAVPADPDDAPAPRGTRSRAPRPAESEPPG
ncbi:MAG: prolipoprotein diacylglyceryl transferase [Chloroflexota bacterium]